MRFVIPALAILALCLGATSSQAASCSTFAKVTAYDEAASTVQISFDKGSVRKFFPQPEGAPNDAQKIPSKCRSKIKKTKDFVVKSSGGRLTMTQVRSNFEGKMVNDTDDAAWLGAKLNEMIGAKTQAVIVIRPGLGKDAPLGITTIYLPITDAELAEIKRIENQAEEMGG